MITVRLESSVPIEEQIRVGIRQSIAQGELRPGDELPSVRQLAGDLGVHWNTVARAYRRLRDEGMLLVGQGRAVQVRADVFPTPSAPDGETRRRVEEKLREALTEAKLGGFSLRRIQEFLERELRDWGKKEATR